MQLYQYIAGHSKTQLLVMLSLFEIHLFFSGINIKLLPMHFYTDTTLEPNVIRLVNRLWEQLIPEHLNNECFDRSLFEETHAPMFPLLVVVATTSRRGDAKVLSLFALQTLCIYESNVSASTCNAKYAHSIYRGSRTSR